MDRITELARERGQLPDRFYNQIDDTRTLQEKYISEKARVMSEILDSDEADETVVILSTTTKRK